MDEKKVECQRVFLYVKVLMKLTSGVDFAKLCLPS